MVQGKGPDTDGRAAQPDAGAGPREVQFFRTLMDAIPDHIYFKDRESRFLRINRAMAEWFALSDPSEAEGKSDEDFFTAEHAQQALRDEQEIMRTGEPLVNAEEKETWPTGGETWVSTTKLALRDETGAIIGTCGISRDITRRKRAQLERERLIADLQQATERIRTLHGLIPICSECGRMRDDKGYWRQVETYLSENSDMSFSHCVCEECSKKLYPRYGDDGRKFGDD
jgi:PAS domain S-box-containing protein